MWLANGLSKTEIGVSGIGGFLKDRKRFLTIILTLIIFGGMVLFTSQAEAVSVSISSSSSNYDSGPATFEVSVVIESDEMIPIDNLSLHISGNGFDKTSTFAPDGTPIENFNNVTITPLSVESSYYGSGPGSGYGYEDYGYRENRERFGYDNKLGENYSFGQGYGYGYQADYPTQLIYEITWDFAADGAPTGDYTATVNVNSSGDGTAHAYSDTVTVTVEPVAEPNVPPIADANGPYSLSEGENMLLDGTGSSDSDGTIEDYNWEIIDGPGSLVNSDTAEPTYVAPDNAGQNVQVEVTVTDDEGASDSDTAMITINPRANRPPVAEAGGPYTVREGESVGLDGTDSSDPDGGSLAYLWTVTDDPTGGASLTESSTPTPVLTVPAVDENTEITVSLTVTDDNDASDSDTATVTIEARPEAPSSEEIENMSDNGAADSLANSDPESAASSMEGVSEEKATGVVQAMINSSQTDAVNDIFTHISDERLNEVWGGLTQEQKDALEGSLSQDVKDRIVVEEPEEGFPWALLVLGVVAVLIVAGLYLWMSGSESGASSGLTSKLGGFFGGGAISVVEQGEELKKQVLNGGISRGKFKARMVELE